MDNSIAKFWTRFPEASGNFIIVAYQNRDNLKGSNSQEDETVPFLKINLLSDVFSKVDL